MQISNIIREVAVQLENTPDEKSYEPKTLKWVRLFVGNLERDWNSIIKVDEWVRKSNLWFTPSSLVVTKMSSLPRD